MIRRPSSLLGEFLFSVAYLGAGASPEAAALLYPRVFRGFHFPNPLQHDSICLRPLSVISNNGKRLKISWAYWEVQC